MKQLFIISGHLENSEVVTKIVECEDLNFAKKIFTEMMLEDVDLIESPIDCYIDTACLLNDLMNNRLKRNPKDEQFSKMMIAASGDVLTKRLPSHFNECSSDEMDRFVIDNASAAFVNCDATEIWKEIKTIANTIAKSEVD